MTVEDRRHRVAARHTARPMLERAARLDNIIEQQLASTGGRRTAR